eukprot:TRINITY_DN32637_c0_g1_i1.p1 TRINITY_DN32637_c0_g1~~TRINITY_DN32637_c0_g1_i1.p1  ORF type:complete len:433 (+),score=79.19 TRINITY_DN32637_c0_g1_i1:96-1394(+)
MKLAGALLPALLHGGFAADPPAWDPPTCMQKVTVPDAAKDGAIYPDGTPANYELNFTGGSGWIIHLSGGGWKWLKSNGSRAEEVGVLADAFGLPTAATRRASAAGSSGAAACQGCYGVCDGLMSNSAHLNPLFHGFNKVFIPWEGTSFTGNRKSTEPYPVRGAPILDAVLKHLQEAHGMKAASDVILTGGSAGGLATYLNCDRIAETVRQANASTRYSCLADAGLFLDHKGRDGKPTTSPLFKESFYAWNSAGATNQACVEHYSASNEEWKCVFAQYVLPFIKSRIFIMQTLYDSWQLTNILKLNCSGYYKPLDDCSAMQMNDLYTYGATLRQLIQMTFIPQPSIGAFAPSCIDHCQSVQNEHAAALWEWSDQWSIGDSTPRKAFDAWYKNSDPSYAPEEAQVVQMCDFGTWHCSDKCKIFSSAFDSRSFVV